MNTALYVKEDGKIYVIGDLPEEPDGMCERYKYVNAKCYQPNCTCADRLNDYRHALTAAKQSAILCVDQDAALNLCWRHDERVHNPTSFLFWKENMLSPGTLYSIPGLKWEIVHLDIEDPVAVILPEQKDIDVTQEEGEMIQRFMGMTVPDVRTPVRYSYKNSWDHLMPVVEKICQFVYDEREEYESNGDRKIIKYTAYPRTFGMLTPEGQFMVRFNRSQLFIAETLIAATYEAVVDWIKLHNQQSK